tara:strand:- start:724 stop:1338 length:615 start_codon:yes stop_codon:yes gene_type:complete
MNYDDIKFDTGDIILFEDKSHNSWLDYLSYLIQYFTDSKYSHVGMVVKDPLIKGKTIKGLYLLESTGLDHMIDIDDHKTKFGVQIVDLHKRLQSDDDIFYYRKLNKDRDETFIDLYNKSYMIVKDKPYDINPLDWCKADFDLKKGNVQKTNTFFCSALVSFMLVSLNILPRDTDWTIMRPKDLGTENGNRLDLSMYNKEIQIKL